VADKSGSAFTLTSTADLSLVLSFPAASAGGPYSLCYAFDTEPFLKTDFTLSVWRITGLSSLWSYTSLPPNSVTTSTDTPSNPSYGAIAVVGVQKTLKFSGPGVGVTAEDFNGPVDSAKWVLPTANIDADCGALEHLPSGAATFEVGAHGKVGPFIFDDPSAAELGTIVNWKVN
jgi:hypothetical protein